MNARSKLLISLSLAGMVRMVGMATMLSPDVGPRPTAPAGIDPDWWGQVCRQIEAEEYQASPSPAGAFEAPNRAQNLRARFEPQGIEIARRTADDPGWGWQWQTAAWGRPGRMEPLAPTEPIGQGSRIEYARGALVEWYENRKEGIEQGFTLAAPPPGEGRVRLEGRIASALAPRPGADRRSIDFLDADGACVLRYGDLEVRDAANQEIHAELLLAGSTLVIEIDDRGAAYPLVVDPLMTSPAWAVESNLANAQLGFSVATAGDVNGDGFSDAIVGAPGYSNGAAESGGRVFVYLGSAAGLGAAAAWYARPGALGGLGELGESVAAAGDVNGDGYGDIIAGAPEFSDHSPAPDAEGQAFVWYGGAAGLGPIGTAANADWVADSDSPAAHLGESVSTAGDVNGDGYDDIVIGTPLLGDPNGPGAAYVWLGSAGGLGADGTPANADWSTAWVQANARMGFSVATAGDVNGDGYADILLGAPGSANGQANEGAAFLWLGGAGGLGASGTPLNADWFAESNQALAALGTSVASAGDVNGDGYADVIIGAPSYNGGLAGEGAAFLWLGGPADLGANGSPANADWTAEGNQATAAFGSSVATAGDVNGDGFADVIVGAPGYDGGLADEGRAFAYLGAWPAPQASAFWTADGGLAGAKFGNAVATAGDVNGDGFADVIAGAWLYSAGQANEGRAAVYHGSAGGPENVAAWVTEGNQAAAMFGWSVASAGDVNGDGYSDIMVGAIDFDNGQDNEGRVFVYAGQPVDPGLVPIWTAESNQIGADFGWSVASAGDVNGDGFSDVIVGARDYDNGEADEGAAFVWFGSAQGLGASGTPSNADWRAEGNQASAQFGISVATAGDVNGDGFCDVIVGADWYDNGQVDEGRAYVYHGSNTGLSGTPDWSEERDQAEEYFGYSVGTAGDVNGDGFSDVIVGAPRFDGSHLDEGRAWVFHGSPSGLSGAAAWFGDVDQENTQFGHSVATAGDVNGDGFSDVIVGAWVYDNGQADEGQAFVYLGSATGLAAAADWTADGDQALAGFGYSVASAGDVNGDGFSDVIVGAPGYDNGQAGEGQVFVFLGSSAGLSAAADWTADGDQVSADFGHSVAPAGDVTGDGFADVIVGAEWFDNPEGNEGRSFIFYGNGTNGLDRIPRQARANDLGPIDLLGRSDTSSTFRLKALGRTAAGRGKLRLEWEVKHIGIPLNGTGLVRGALLDTGAPTNRGSAVGMSELVTGLPAETAYHWRVRTVSRSPFFPRSPWFSPPGNGRNETDLRTVAPGSGVAEAPAAPAASLRLLGSRPNPVRAASAIGYVLPAAGRVRLAIYDVGGRAVASLVDRVEAAGTHEARWDGRGDRGERLAAGVYFARLAAGGEVRAEKLVLME